MTTLKASAARSKLCRLIDETASSHKPIVIVGKRANAVLVSEADWRAIQETVYLLSISRMRQSIRKGLATPIGQCGKQLSSASSK
jgi:prevent-host-death family protein